MGYGCWCALRIRNHQDQTIIICNAKTEWGSFYRYPEKSDYIYGPDLEGTRINEGDTFIVAARGNDKAAAGTSGIFEIWTDWKKICTIEFSSPYSDNTIRICRQIYVHPDFKAERTDIDLFDEPLGDVLWRVGRDYTKLLQAGKTAVGYKRDPKMQWPSWKEGDDRKPPEKEKKKAILAEILDAYQFHSMIASNQGHWQ